MSTPSLLNIPYLIKAGTLYSQIPETGLGDFAVTRATTPTANRSTRVNSLGFIELVNDNVPRLDYPLGGAVNGCPALLVEPQAQNLAWHSQTWANGTNWAISRITTITGTTDTLDPLGTNTANAISPTAVSGTHVAESNDGTQISFTSGTIYTQSAFFKQGVGLAGRYIQLTFRNTRFTQLGYANFDLQLGTVAVVSGTSADSNRTASIENYGNGWYRCRFTATCNSTGTGVGVTGILITASGDTRFPSFTGVTGDVLYGWGAQLEVGSVATSYIPTTTAAIARGTDVVLKTSIASLIGQSEGTMYAEFDVAFNNRNTDIISLDSGGTQNGFFVTIRNSGLVQLIVRQSAANALIFQRTGAIPVGINKVAIAYKNGDFAISLNGTAAQVDTTSITMPSVAISRATIGLGQLYSLEQPVKIRSAVIYPNRLTNAQLATLTTP